MDTLKTFCRVTGQVTQVAHIHSQMELSELTSLMNETLDEMNVKNWKIEHGGPKNITELKIHCCQKDVEVDSDDEEKFTEKYANLKKTREERKRKALYTPTTSTYNAGYLKYQQRYQEREEYLETLHRARMA